MRLLLVGTLIHLADIGMLGSFAPPTYACIRWRGGWRWVWSADERKHLKIRIHLERSIYRS